MIQATVTLFQNCKLTPEKNFVVDNITAYLSTLESTNATYNFVRHNLDLTLIVAESMGILSYTLAGKYNYAEIQNSDESAPVRYFIVDRQFNAENSVRLTLKMDVLNSFALGSDYSFTENTRIVRQHKNRFSNTIPQTQRITQVEREPGYIVVYLRDFLGYIHVIGAIIHANGNDIYKNKNQITQSPVADDETYIKIKINYAVGEPNPDYVIVKYQAASSRGARFIIDRFPEGLSPITERVRKQELLTGNTFKTHYLVFETKDGQIRTLLRAKEPHSVNISEVYETIALERDTWTIFAPKAQTHLIVDFSVLGVSKSWKLENDGVSFDFAGFRKTSAGNILEYGLYHCAAGIITASELVTTSYSLTLQITCKWSNTDAEQPATWRGGWSTGISPDDYTTVTWNHSTTTTSSVRAVVIHDLSTIDTYSSNLNKIIAIPFMPGLTGWRYEDYTNNGFVNARLSEIYRDTTFNIETSANTSFTRAAIMDYPGYDPKLYSSEFYFQKIGYDSFGLMLKFENVKRNAHTVNIRLQSTTTMTSALMLKVTNEDDVYDIIDEDINGVLICRRNNEMPIYNSEYLNYLQVGYNYDKKAKDRTLRSAKIQVGAKVVGGVSQALIGATRAVSGDLIAGVSSLAGGVASVVSAVDSYNSQVESTVESFDRKVAELERQTASIGAADDFELCEGYGGDTFKLYTYQAPERILDAVDRMFRLYGYKCDEFGVPNVKSRHLWNFIQCNPEFVYSNAFIVGLPAIIRDTLVNKYREGVTFLHDVTSRTAFELIGNNYESFIDE